MEVVMGGSRQEMDTLVETFSRLVRDSGVHAGLGFLNARTRHRFTGVYRFEPPMLRSISLFDRENSEVRAAHDKLLRDTYCAMVADTGEPFMTEDSLADERLASHPARRSVVAYHAVPLLGVGGACFGSLCHWDVRPRLVPDREVPFLFAVAPLIARAIALEPASGVRH